MYPQSTPSGGASRALDLFRRHWPEALIYTAIMLLAIATGAWAMIFMTALMRGMVDQMVEDGIDALPGYVQVHHPRYRDDPNIENSLAEPGAAFRAAMDIPEVRGWTSRVRVPAMVSSARDSRAPPA